MMTADWLGLTPDYSSAVLEARKNVAETLAVQLSKLAENGEQTIIKTVLDSINDRNKDVVAIALQLSNGDMLVKSGDAEVLQNLNFDNVSTPTRFLVPIYSGDKLWGQVAIHYRPLVKQTILGFHLSPWVLLLMFIGATGYVLYHLFLKRALSYLDPAAVIPDRVKTAMDILAEGVLILNEKELIVLANRAFTEKTGTLQYEIMGKRPTTLPWEITDEHGKKIDLPWTTAIKETKPQMAVALHLETKDKGRRTFMVNSAPILDGKGKTQGVLTTFDDVTQLERKNTQLSTMLTHLEKTQEEVQRKNQELVILASQDPLTDCLNRRAFMEILEDNLKLTQNGNYTVTCIMTDIDHFKLVNDTYGHGVGDQVIRKVADAIRDSLREGDEVCRYGGEEFCIMLRDTTSNKARQLAERIRTSVEKFDFSNDEVTKDLKISSSFGISDSTLRANTPTELINQADSALYGAKESGRNKVVLWQSLLAKQAVLAVKETGTQKNSSGKTAPPVLSSVLSDSSRLESRAGEDDLTGLPGRTLFLGMIYDAIKKSSVGNDQVAVLLIDINDFKRINNLLGYKVGDCLLKEESRRLAEILRSSDGLVYLNKEKSQPVISRLSGDKFGVLLHNLPTNARIKSIVKRIIESLAEPYNIGEHSLYMTTSVGISVHPQDGRNADTLLKHAEVAMDFAKILNGHNYHFYTSALETETIEELNLENDLRIALAGDELEMFYQPKVCLTENRMVGMEALIRWRHPVKGLVLPKMFLAIAEKTGLIHELGVWVFRTACIQARKWKEQGFRDLTVAINISATQFIREGFSNEIISILTSTGTNPKLVEIEVTEYTMVHNIEAVTTIIENLRRIGIKVSLDDFGTGYSSLHYIKKFPIDSLKIDISFIQNITTDTSDFAIVSAIIAMAHAMNIKVIAEGVENNEQLQILKELHCDQIQGYIFSRPKSGPEATELLLSESPGVITSANNVLISGATARK